MSSLATPILCSVLCAGVLIPQVGAADKSESERTGEGVRLTMQSLPLDFTQTTSVTSGDSNTLFNSSGENDSGGQIGLWSISGFNPQRKSHDIYGLGVIAARVWQHTSQGVIENRLYGLGFEMAGVYSLNEGFSLEFGGMLAGGWADMRLPETVNGVTTSTNHSNAGVFGEVELRTRAVFRPAPGIDLSLQAGYMGLHQWIEFNNTATNTQTVFISRAKGFTVGCGIGFVY